jgi:hypothetical protein
MKPKCMNLSSFAGLYDNNTKLAYPLKEEI